MFWVMPALVDETLAAGHESLTDVARVALSFGRFDALRAVHFPRRFPAHFHDTFAIGVVESGVTRLVTPRGTWMAREGTILAFSPGEIHAALPLTADGLTYRMVYPSPAVMREIGVDVAAVEAGHPLFRLPVIDDPDLGAQIRRVHEPLMDAQASGRVVEGFVAALKRLVRQYGNHDGGALPHARISDRLLVERAQSILHERFTRPVPLAALADECGRSPYHLNRVFSRIIGVAPHAYLVQLRVNRAQELLSNGAAISDVAYSCGFSDQAHFTRTFKEMVGVTPGKYRRATAL
jgi:AraC-like DNA-binding protein